MADAKSIISARAARRRRVTFRWWGGIGFRVSFFMMVALILVAALVGAFFFWEGKKTLDAEIRGRALYIGRELSALTRRHHYRNRLNFPKKFPFAVMTTPSQEGRPLPDDL
jgi:hypothetical protein